MEKAKKDYIELLREQLPPEVLAVWDDAKLQGERAENMTVKFLTDKGLIPSGQSARVYRERWGSVNFSYFLTGTKAAKRSANLPTYQAPTGAAPIAAAPASQVKPQDTKSLPK